MIELIKLPYAYDEFDSVIDKETMEIHHSRHHNAYVTNYNNAVKGTELEGKSVAEVIANIDNVDASIKTAVQNNGGGILNHNLYFTQFKNGVELVDGPLKTAIISTFGSIEELITKLQTAGATRFGSGWSWLVIKDDKLEVISTLNQDSPLMQGMTPILGIDVWEHAYYLKYQNKRPEYLKNIFSIIDWNEIEARYLAAIK